MKIWKGLLVLLLTITTISGCSSDSQGQKEEASAITKYEEVIKDAGNEKEEILSIMDYLNQNTTYVFRSLKETSVDNKIMSQGQAQIWKGNDGYCLYTQYKNSDVYQESLRSENYNAFAFVYCGESEYQDAMYNQKEKTETNKEIFLTDYSQLKVKKESGKDNTFIYYLESDTTYIANVENGIEDKKGILYEEITVNERAEIIYVKTYIIDVQTQKQPENIYTSEYIYSKYNEDVSIDEESIYQSMKELEGKKSKDVQDFIKI